jgi:hypothetical protein
MILHYEYDGRPEVENAALYVVNAFRRSLEIAAGAKSRHHNNKLRFVPWEAEKEEGP